MKITVIIPSRGRPRGLCAVITSLNTLSSGKNQINYGVCRDNDDPLTGIACKWISKDIPLHVRNGERPESLGGLVNEMAENLPADIYTAVSDDVICVTPNWDEILVEEAEKTPHGVFFWKNALPHDPYYAIVTEKWREAAGGIFTNDFPYWFDDLHLLELWVMTTLTDPIQIDRLKLADKAVDTIRMRELPFWQKVFTATRKRRVESGIEIAKKLGLPTPTGGDLIRNKLDEVVKAVSDEWLESIEKSQGESGEPDPSYVRAKDKALKLLEELNVNTD